MRFAAKFIWNWSYLSFGCALVILKFIEYKFLNPFGAFKSAIKIFPILWDGKECCLPIRFVDLKNKSNKKKLKWNLPFFRLSQLFFSPFLLFVLLICLIFLFLHFFSNTKAALSLSAWRVFFLFASSSSSSKTWKHYWIWC